MQTKITSEKAPKAAGPYSQAIVSGNLIFLAGQIHLTPEGKLIDGTVEEKIEQIMNNLKNVLESAGSDFSKVVKTTIFVTDMSIYGKVNEVYGKYMQDPFPARETVCVKELPLGAQIEISMIAEK